MNWKNERTLIWATVVSFNSNSMWVIHQNNYILLLLISHVFSFDFEKLTTEPVPDISHSLLSFHSSTFPWWLVFILCQATWAIATLHSFPIVNNILFFFAAACKNQASFLRILSWQKLLQVLRLCLQVKEKMSDSL
jgi:hypothetical protein